MKIKLSNKKKEKTFIDGGIKLPKNEFTEKRFSKQEMLKKDISKRLCTDSSVLEMNDNKVMNKRLSQQSSQSTSNLRVRTPIRLRTMSKPLKVFDTLVDTNSNNATNTSKLSNGRDFSNIFHFKKHISYLTKELVHKEDIINEIKAANNSNQQIDALTKENTKLNDQIKHLQELIISNKTAQEIVALNKQNETNANFIKNLEGFLRLAEHNIKELREKNEKLKQKMNRQEQYEDKINTLSEDNKKLQEENENLKEENEYYVNMITSLIEKYNHLKTTNYLSQYELEDIDHLLSASISANNVSYDKLFQVIQENIPDLTKVIEQISSILLMQQNEEEKLLLIKYILTKANKEEKFSICKLKKTLRTLMREKKEVDKKLMEENKENIELLLKGCEASDSKNTGIISMETFEGTFNMVFGDKDKEKNRSLFEYFIQEGKHTSLVGLYQINYLFLSDLVNDMKIEEEKNKQQQLGEIGKNFVSSIFNDIFNK